MMSMSNTQLLPKFNIASPLDYLDPENRYHLAAEAADKNDHHVDDDDDDVRSSEYFKIKNNHVRIVRPGFYSFRITLYDCPIADGIDHTTSLFRKNKFLSNYQHQSREVTACSRNSDSYVFPTIFCNFMDEISLSPSPGYSHIPFGGWYIFTVIFTSDNYAV